MLFKNKLFFLRFLLAEEQSAKHVNLVRELNVNLEREVSVNLEREQSANLERGQSANLAEDLVNYSTFDRYIIVNMYQILRQHHY